MKKTTKEYFQYCSALLMILSGIVLTYASFVINGDVTNGVLWYMAQALTFAGGVFGVSLYFHAKLGEFRSEITEYINSKISTAK